MTHQPQPQSFTKYGWAVCAWVLVVSFQYGYHISTLNQIQVVLTCRGRDDSIPFYYGLPTCLPMSDATFSIVTSVFTVGGLLGSLGANLVMDRFGRKGAVQASSAFFALGAGLMGISAYIGPLMFGRVLTGAGAGIGLCVGPIYLSEIAPKRIEGSVGVLTQLAIVLGIMITQAMGLRMATPTQWRLVLLFSSALSVGQLLLGPLIVESPVWLRRNSAPGHLKTVYQKLWRYGQVRDSDDPLRDTEDPLLESREEEDGEDRGSPADRPSLISVPQLFTSRSLRRPFFIVSFGMLAQQLSGINAVLYYSNDILSKSLPDLGPYVSLGITIVNALMTFPPIFLIERLGRRTLLVASFTGAFVSLLLVGFGLDSGVVTLSSVAIMTFVMTFAIGLGPVPFVIIPEVSPANAVSALSSVALSINLFMATIKDINSKAELEGLLEQKKDNLLVIDFHATWCGPCHAIAPVFTRLSQEFQNVAFVRVDVDLVPAVARMYAVSAMPTFVFIRNKRVVAQLKGADPRQLESMIREKSAESSSGTSGSGSGSSATRSDSSLLEHLQLPQVNCLNEAKDHTLQGICSAKRKNSTDNYLLSDVDEQLLLNIEFNQTVRVRSIVIQSKNLAQAPKEIKLLVNRPSVGFDEVQDAQEPEVAQVVELTEEQATQGIPVPLRFVRFQSVNSLHIFVMSNQGGEDETRIDAIDVFGLPAGVTRDFSGLKKVEDD